MGHPRPPGRAGGRAAARHHLQARDRGLRHRRVQRALPRVGVRVPRGLAGADGAHRLLGRSRPRVPDAGPDVHRVGLVGAEEDRRQGPALRGLQGRPLLPALRHGAVEPRGGARLQGRRRPVALRADAGDRGRRAGPARRRAARLDHDALDPGRERGDRRRPRAHVRAREDGRPGGAGRARGGARRARARRGGAGARALPRRRAGRRALRGAVPVPARPRVGRARAHRAAGGLRLRRRRHGPRAHGDRLRRGRLPARRALRPERRQPGAPRRHVRRAHRQVRRPLRQGRRHGPHRGPQAPRPRAARGGARALLPALLALGQPAHLLREADVVHRDLDAARPPRGGQRGGQLAPGAHQARAVRRLAGGQRRLGPLARALLGDAAAGLARRGRQRHGHRLLRRARGALGREGHRPAPPLRRRHHVPEPRLGQDRAPRPRGHRRVVRLRGDAVRAVARALREPGGVRGAVPGRLRLRGDRPDPRVVLLPARDLGAAERPADVPQRRVPRPDPRRRGPEDVEVQGQHRRALGRHRPLRRRRVPLVLLHVQAAVGRLPLLHGRDRRGRPPVPAPALERLRVLRPLRALRGAVRRRGDRPGPLDPLAGRRDRRGGHRAAGRLRRDVRRPRDRRARRRPLQLVRPPLAAALLGRRRERAADAARDARHRVPAARAVHAVHRRRDLREPRRLRAVRAPHRLARGRRRATSSSSATCASRARP